MKNNILAGGLLLAAACTATARNMQAPDLADLTLEQLGDVRVTSVTGRPEPVRDAAASIFVITTDDIRRSAATNLPEALRLAPNLQVAQLNGTQYAISARGFNNAIGNKLLVLVDGRTVYSPLFSGVFWDEQDVMLEDVARIEVISGPGATLWGANAVNGVINVITRSAADTQGVLASATAGREGTRAALRQGGQLGAQGHYRVYALHRQYDNTVLQSGAERPDATSRDQLGFRADWAAGADEITLQGDGYRGGRNASSNLAPLLHGGNLLARWTRHDEQDGDWQLQAYLDNERRDDLVLFQTRTRTVDLQFNHSSAPTGAQRLLWGAGYRRARSEADATPLVLFDPQVRELAWSNVFVQDELQLSGPLHVTLGAKLEHNVYTGTEVLPTLRATYRLTPASLVWSSLSRAVRAPARIDRDFHFPAQPPFLINGGPDFESEVANVAELGYRYTGPRVGYDLTLFHHQDRKLRGGQPGRSTIQNRIAGVVEGLEAWGHVQVNPQWRLSAGLLELRESLRASPGTSPNSISDLGNDPARQWMLRVSANPWQRVQFDMTMRHVGALPRPAVQAYTATDLRLAVQPTPQLSVSLLVQNAFDPQHAEFNAVNAASQLPRAAYLQVTWVL